MASRLTLALCGVALVALPGIARAQSAPEPAPSGGIGAAVPDEPAKPDEPKPDEPKPDEVTPDAGQPDAGQPDAAKPAEPKPDAGTPDAGTPDVGTPDVGTPAKPAEAMKPPRRAREAGFDTVLLGFGLGIAGVSGTPAEVYPAAYGAQVAIGVGRGPFSFEARVALGYGSLPKQEALRGDNTRASLTLHSVIVRAMLPIAPVSVGVFAGLASGEVPVLVAGADVDHPESVAPTGIEGVGITAGASVHYRFSKHGELLAELALYDLAWELPGHGYVVHPTAVDAMTTTVDTSNDDISATPWQLTIGVRAIIGD